MHKRLNSRQELATLREKVKAALDRQKVKLLVCAGTGCVAGGSLNIYNRLSELIAERNLPHTVELQVEPHDDSVGSHALPRFAKWPVARIEPQGWLYTKVKSKTARKLSSARYREIIERLVYHKNGQAYPRQDDIPL